MEAGVDNFVYSLHSETTKEEMPVSEVYRALGDPTRRRILQLLREREMSAGEIAEHFQLAKPTLSGHFNVLRAAGLIHANRRRTAVIYHLNISVLEEALIALLDGFGFVHRELRVTPSRISKEALE